MSPWQNNNARNPFWWLVWQADSLVYYRGVRIRVAEHGCFLANPAGPQEGKEEIWRSQLQCVLHVWTDPDPGVQGGEFLSRCLSPQILSPPVCSDCSHWRAGLKHAMFCRLSPSWIKTETASSTRTTWETLLPLWVSSLCPFVFLFLLGGFETKFGYLFV